MRILFIDIETAPNLCYTWGLWKQNIHIDNIIEEGYTLCASYKWYKDKKIHFTGINEFEPKVMFQELADVISDADVIVHYNGSNFDMPILNKEFIKHGIWKPAPYHTIDMLQVVRKVFKFQSNKLDFVARSLGLGSKVQHKGMELWHGCMEMDESSWRVMTRYNKQDVRLLENLYVHMLPWIDGHPNAALYVDNNNPVCIACGSTNIGPRGVSNTKLATYPRYWCKDCGKWLRGRFSIVPKERRKAILTEART